MPLTERASQRVPNPSNLNGPLFRQAGVLLPGAYHAFLAPKTAVDRSGKGPTTRELILSIFIGSAMKTIAPGHRQGHQHQPAACLDDSTKQHSFDYVNLRKP